MYNDNDNTGVIWDVSEKSKTFKLTRRLIQTLKKTYDDVYI